MTATTLKALVSQIAKLNDNSKQGWAEKCRLEGIIRQAADASDERIIGDCYDYAEAHPDQEVSI